MIPIVEQIACVKRELALRDQLYPKFVASGRLEAGRSDTRTGADARGAADPRRPRTLGPSPLMSVLHEGDCREVIPQLAGEGIVVDAVVTDAPYHLTDLASRAARKFTANGDTSRRRQENGAMSRLAGGFMGQRWDGGDIAFRPETWATVASVLRPGGFLLAFGGTRTYHRLACAIEDAGLVIQDAIGWLYGSGFPKRRDMLKPAMELICVAYKPSGTRTLQVDECRVGFSADSDAKSARPGGRATGKPFSRLSQINDERLIFAASDNRNGRWPANLAHDGSDEVLEAFVKFGESSSSAGMRGLMGRHDVSSPETMRIKPGTNTMRGHSDAGTPARFFYCAKAGGEDRWGSRHPTVKPVELLKWLVPLVTPVGGTFLDPFAGSGTAAVAALATGRNAILIEREPGYCADIRERIAHYEGNGRHSLASKARGRIEQPGSLL